MANSLSGQALVGATYYAILRDAVDITKVWNGTAFETWSSGNYATYVISPSLITNSGIYNAPFPGTSVKVDSGDYPYELRIRSTATPLITDVVSWADVVEWSGTKAVDLGTILPLNRIRTDSFGNVFVNYGSGDVVIPPATITGYYTTLQEMYNIFGVQNIIVFSDMNNTDPLNSTLDTIRVYNALEYADNEINMILLDGPYTIPLSLSPITSSTMRYIAAIFAGEWLYRSRGIREESVEGNKYLREVKESRRKLQLIKGGMYRIDAARRWPTPSAPFGMAY